MSKPTLRLGKVDKGNLPTDVATFLAPYHPFMAATLKKKLKFRDEGNAIWRKFQEIQGTAIQELQEFLKETGFMPKANVDGIYGYGTTAAVRLFQEYVRTIDKDVTIGKPDGIAGPNTLAHIDKWKKEKTGTDEYISQWGRASVATPSEEYKHWMSLLAKGKQHYLTTEHQILKHIDNFPSPTDTRKIQDWDVSTNTIHLLGIRRNQEESLANHKNDDLFILLIKGMVFCFWGSTDPNPEMAKKTSEPLAPFLIEGQHEYTFGWHKVSSYNQIYKALRPASTGVIVFRDIDNNYGLTEEDILKGLDDRLATDINIHWSGIGSYNFSAGCQVVAGGSYINHLGDLIDCREFASRSYKGLKNGQTRGAYNMLADLILTYAPIGVTTLAYTLTRDDTAFLSDQLTVELIEEVVKQMKKG